MDNWYKTLKLNYKVAAQKLHEAGWQHRKVQGVGLGNEVFVKDGYAVYLGRRLGSTEFTTYPINL